MTESFFEQLILNSPYEPPRRDHALDAKGQALNTPTIEGGRKSELISRVPLPKKEGKKARQAGLDLDLFAEQDEGGQADTLAIINEVSSSVTEWCNLNKTADWGVTPVTQRLLQCWRHQEFEADHPLFRPIGAVEMAIWLTEVAANPEQHAHAPSVGPGKEYVSGRSKSASPAKEIA